MSTPNKINTNKTNTSNSHNASSNAEQMTLPYFSIASAARFAAARSPSGEGTDLGVPPCLSYRLALVHHDLPRYEPSDLVSLLDAVLAIVEEDNGSTFSSSLSAEDAVFAEKPSP
jgi:hypothetical protein